MLVKKLINTLEELNKPQSFIRLHGPEGKEISRLNIEKKVVLIGEYDVCGMTVQWLINTLKKVNPEQRIYLDNKNAEEALFVVSFISPEKYSNIICLETESDNDMGAELEERFKNAIEDYSDEADFYLDLLEMGIDADMIHKYLGAKQADHMIEFCENHGLI